MVDSTFLARLAQLTVVSVCKDDSVCSAFATHRPPTSETDPRSEDDDAEDMVCYQGGLAVNRNFQMCDVTSERA